MQEVYDRVLAHPQFAELTRRRNRFAWRLSAVMLTVYYSFVLMASLRPELFSSPLSEGLTWCLGLVGGFIIQMFCFAMTGIYVRRANGEFDALNRAIVAEVTR